MDRDKVRRIVNIFLVIAVAGSWAFMFMFGEGSLAQNGIHSLKYFTVLSNLFVGVTSAIWLIRTRKGNKNDKAEKSDKADNGDADQESANAESTASSRIEVLKYVAAASVGLTFTTVMVFLGPLYGYPAMFAGASLFMHLITPVTAVLEVIFLSDATFSPKDNRLVILAPLIYGLFYLGNIIVNGFGEWPDYNDWYLFFTWGYPIGILIYAIICVVTWLIGLMMRKLQRGKASE